MKNENFKVKTYSGIRLWWHKRKERKYVERISRPVIVLGNIKL